MEKNEYSTSRGGNGKSNGFTCTTQHAAAARRKLLISTMPAVTND